MAEAASNPEVAITPSAENDENSAVNDHHDTNGSSSGNHGVVLNQSRLLLRPSALSHGGPLKPATLSCPTGPSSLSPVLKFHSNNKLPAADGSGEGKTNLPPKVVSTSTPVPKIPVTVSISNPNYVFGQNISDRVEKPPVEDNNQESGMLFSSSLNKESNMDNGEKKEGPSLLEDAARCQEQRATKRKYEEVRTATGEENEQNVLQVVAKLFAFEGGSWVERGRGTLRLNDSSGGGSRLVVRTLGSLRVVLNSKIWTNMQLSRASERSIRITAMDSQGTPKIFLIQANPSDITHLYSCLEARLKTCREDEVNGVKNECESTSNGLNVVDKENEENNIGPKSPKTDANSSRGESHDLQV